MHQTFGELSLIANEWSEGRIHSPMVCATTLPHGHLEMQFCASWYGLYAHTLHCGFAAERAASTTLNAEASGAACSSAFGIATLVAVAAAVIAMLV